MASGMLGMDIADCTKGKSELENIMKEIDRLGNDLDQKIQASSAFWQGPDSDQFRKEDGSKVKQEFAQIKTALTALISRLDKNITQQKTTSSKK